MIVTSIADDPGHQVQCSALGNCASVDPQNAVEHDTTTTATTRTSRTQNDHDDLDDYQQTASDHPADHQDRTVEHQDNTAKMHVVLLLNGWVPVCHASY